MPHLGIYHPWYLAKISSGKQPALKQHEMLGKGCIAWGFRVIGIHHLDKKIMISDTPQCENSIPSTPPKFRSFIPLKNWSLHSGWKTPTLELERLQNGRASRVSTNHKCITNVYHFSDMKGVTISSIHIFRPNCQGLGRTQSVWIATERHGRGLEAPGQFTGRVDRCYFNVALKASTIISEFSSFLFRCFST